VTDIQAAYEDTNYEVVAVGAGNKYEVPSSTPAVFTTEPEITSAAQVERALTGGECMTIAPHTERNGDGGFYVSSKVCVGDTNEFAHVKASNGLVRIFPKGDEFSRATLATLVERFEGELGVTLTHDPRDTEDTE